jgi:hypothetical protein
MRPKRFVKAVMGLKWAEVLDDGDVRRVQELYREAIEHSADHALVGFRVPGPVVQIVWAVVEVIPLGQVTGEDLAPDLRQTEHDWEA